MIKTDFQVVNQDGISVYDGHFLLSVPVRSDRGKAAELIISSEKEPWHVVDFGLDPERIYTFRDFSPGEGGTTMGRTVVESDILCFSALTGDYNPLYVDAEYAAAGPFGERAAPGLLAFNMAFGLWMRDSGAMRTKSSNRSRVAGHLNDSAIFYRPVRIGDTLRCRYRIEEGRVSQSKPHLGILRFGFQLLDQHDSVVQEGKTLMLRSTE